ncbi:MAG: histidine kinase [Anaerocolumna sp.]|jgi:two-component system sensor histidine kinase KdpD|nr:histidine kinase [Anaerocolumna sp.]
MDVTDNRPDPEAILIKLQEKEEKEGGKLKIFFGYAAGVGKTYAMLDEALEHYRWGSDVLVGYVEPHDRPETLKFLEELPVLPPKSIAYKNMELKEFDLDEALRRKPKLILVDELAHTNSEGSRNRKRYQDVEELLHAGIDVFTTVNVQHLESLNNVVEDVMKVTVRETVPDYIFDQADMVKVIDIEPEELLYRLKEGKVYHKERARTAMSNFFAIDNLRILREIALRKATDRISNENQSERFMQEKMANTKFLVCISGSPSSAKCIRWTARAAEAFHAHWIAIYVEDEENLSTEQKQTVRNNMELAEKMGAEVNTLMGHDIAETIAEYARLAGITNIVVGKSRNKKTIKSLFDMDFEDRLIALLPAIEVHIIPDNTGVKRFRSQKAQKFIRPHLKFKGGDWLKTFGILLAAMLLCEGLQFWEFGNQNDVMIFILSVLIISRITEGYFYGIFASLLSVLIFNFFFTKPYFTFNAIENGYPLTFVIMLLTSLITSALTVRIKRQARFAAEREHRIQVLYEINKKLLVTRGTDNIIALVLDYGVKLFGRSAILYIRDEKGELTGSYSPFPEEDDSFMITEDEKAVAHWVFVNGKKAGAGTDTLMGAGAFYEPVLFQGNVLAVIGLSCKGGNLDHNNRLFLRMITPLVAMAFERQRLSDEQRNILVETEKEKMRSNLLRAISHDLRTPLTGILGASSAILENEGSINADTSRQLIVNIKEDSQWLIRMVENLLSVTRINEGTMNVSKTLEAGEEVIAEAVSRIRKRYGERNIQVKVPEEFLEVPMDGTLIAQVLINLLENAIKHSREEALIEVSLRKKENWAVFEVLDNGKGIPEEDLPSLFEGYTSLGGKASDSSRGLGIGLSICRSIIKAHQGRMEAENRLSGGAAFRFLLPLEETIS